MSALHTIRCDGCHAERSSCPGETLGTLRDFLKRSGWTTQRAACRGELTRDFCPLCTADPTRRPAEWVRPAAQGLDPLEQRQLDELRAVRGL